jgi:predicted nucleotide-binding protein (sugar kinase/HSP70/actin superfamily)
MKAVTVKELNQELINRTPKELRELCLRLSKFKKENKELLTYILFESSDEASYAESVKREIDKQFEQINKKSYYFIKKGLRKILLNIKKYSRYSQKKKTEVDLLIYFCVKLKKFTPFIQKNTRLRNLYNGQIETIRKKVSSLHEDLQYDYGVELNALNNLPAGRS